eukprot:2637532-Amphidinium_carterae.1
MSSGLATGAPIRLLALACRAYSGARVISFGKMVGPSFQYNAGVVPGCKLANRLIMCLTLPLLMELLAQYPSIHTVSLLDDWSFHAVGTALEVEHTLVPVTDRAVQWFAERDLPLAV